MTRAETAVDTFRKGFNCSQAVLSAFCSELGLERPISDRIASGFGGGIGHLAETCGAVTEAVMVIGLKKGMFIPDHPSRSNKLGYELVNSFATEFIKRNNSIKCCDLLGCDISDPEMYLKASQEGRFYNICPKYVSYAVEILENLLEMKRST
ncbi:MAG: C_GCAxxG_C_C family protein [Dehalococcoidia bacterium]|nr:C_GCAxxG_C_C family protein [Dehalococcoidia bacterium]